MPGYTGRNRSAAEGGPQGVQRSYASNLKEREALFNSYEHLQGLPRGDAALDMLRKIASQVKPIMRKRGWKVQVLAEFLPPEQNLLGLNINKGYKICIRLRYHHNPDLFLPMEQVVDTMLHELSHNIWGDHDSKFHALWDQLRDEYETLLRKGYTGEGFLSEGHTLGGRGAIPPPDEMRRLARESAEKRKAQGVLGIGSGRKLGGTPLHMLGRDIRNVITDQITRRNAINKGCASGRGDADKLSQTSSITSFKTKAEEDDANDRAIAQALYELMQEEEEQKLRGTFSTPSQEGGLSWSPEVGLYDQASAASTTRPSLDIMSPLTEDEQMRLAMEASMRDQVNQNPPRDFPSPVSSERGTRDSYTPLQQDHLFFTTARAHDLPSSPEMVPEPVPNPISQRVEDFANYTEQQKATKRKRGEEPETLPTSGRATGARTSLEEVPVIDLSEPFNPDEWACASCTYINPVRYLACDACGGEKPQPQQRDTRPTPSFVPGTRWKPPTRPQVESLGWNCDTCGAFMEHRWWTCSACGTMKTSS